MTWKDCVSPSRHMEIAVQRTSGIAMGQSWWETKPPCNKSHMIKRKARGSSVGRLGICCAWNSWLRQHQQRRTRSLVNARQLKLISCLSEVKNAGWQGIILGHLSLEESRDALEGSLMSFVQLWIPKLMQAPTSIPNIYKQHLGKEQGDVKTRVCTEKTELFKTYHWSLIIGKCFHTLSSDV